MPADGLACVIKKDIDKRICEHERKAVNKEAEGGYSETVSSERHKLYLILFMKGYGNKTMLKNMKHRKITAAAAALLLIILILLPVPLRIDRGAGRKKNSV